MGDEVRSVHSLSGGESFLVSLSLALGLASLTSERVRVESLFIDEGFGSLDPETLNFAMGALMQLESQGRKVGIISHVQEMTDAIPVQIRVEKGRGGASRVVIPGTETISYSDDKGGICRVDNPAGEPVSGTHTGDLAVRMKAVLQRETDAGRTKVSTRTLREELGCSPAEFKAAQSALSSEVIQEGRSLQLRDEFIS
jgi:energy-coupling factor transporter ATP-binding protein EcfA2